MTKPTLSDRTVVSLLIALAAFPVCAGLVRVVGLAGGPELIPDHARIASTPVPVVLHILSAGVYCFLGAFQFAAGLRRRRPTWHRNAGRIVISCGLLVALTALWMTLLHRPAAGDGVLIAFFRLVFGSAMFASLALGIAAIRRRDFATHGAWMTRAYAIGQGAGTQSLTLMAWGLLVGTPDGLPRALLHAVSWAINLAVAERIIHARSARTRIRAASAPPGLPMDVVAQSPR